METPAPDAPIRVLLVDDDPDDHVLTRDMLESIAGGNFQLDWQSTYEAGLKGVCCGGYDVVLLDYKLGGKTGLDLLAAARAQNCDTPIILLTGLTDPEIDLAAMRRGAAQYLEKSRLDATLLERAIRYAIQQKQIEAELERRVAERTEALNSANERLLEVNRRKDEFLATLGHELRNPLAPIRNALEIMRLAEGNPDVAAGARAIVERQVAHMVRLIDDLLEVSRISRGKLRLERDRALIREIVDAAVEQSKPLLDQAGLTLKFDLPAEPVWLVCDRLRLAQVFTNILNNAAKYSDPGGVVTVAARRIESNLEVRIRDTGIGIPPEMLSRVFDQFAQVDPYVERAQGGLGIGLNLVRRLVEMHEGTVTARSDGRGQGAEFTVTLPCEPQA